LPDKPAKGKKKTSAALQRSPHRANQLETPSDQFDYQMMKMVDEKPHMFKHNKMKAALARAELVTSIPVMPKQPSPVKRVHFSSPLRSSPKR
jgi:hypothetical protein